MEVFAGLISDHPLPQNEGEIRSLIGDARAEIVLKNKTEKSRKLSFCAGMVLKQALSSRGIDITRARFGTEENGKPYLADHPDVFFNISHSGSSALAVVSDKPAGCDIQIIRNKEQGRLFAMAKRFFSDGEIGYLTELKGDPELFKTAFYLIFSAKESFIKCTGEGLKRPLSSFEVPLFEEGGMCRIDGKDYRFSYYRPDDADRLFGDDVTEGSMNGERYVAVLCKFMG